MSAYEPIQIATAAHGYIAWYAWDRRPERRGIAFVHKDVVCWALARGLPDEETGREDRVVVPFVIDDGLAVAADEAETADLLYVGLTEPGDSTVDEARDRWLATATDRFDYRIRRRAERGDG